MGDIPNNGSITLCFKLPSNKDLKITPKWTTTDGEAENREDVSVLAAVLPEDAKKAVRMAFSAIFDSTDDSLKDAATAFLEKLDTYQC